MSRQHLKDKKNYGKIWIRSTFLSILIILHVRIAYQVQVDIDFIFDKRRKKVLYGKCSKISNTLKLRTPKIIAENNF